MVLLEELAHVRVALERARLDEHLNEKRALVAQARRAQRVISGKVDVTLRVLVDHRAAHHLEVGVAGVVLNELVKPIEAQQFKVADGDPLRLLGALLSVGEAHALVVHLEVEALASAAVPVQRGAKVCHHVVLVIHRVRCAPRRPVVPARVQLREEAILQSSISHADQVSVGPARKPRHEVPSGGVDLADRHRADHLVLRHVARVQVLRAAAAQAEEEGVIDLTSNDVTAILVLAEGDAELELAHDADREVPRALVQHLVMLAALAHGRLGHVERLAVRPLQLIVLPLSRHVRGVIARWLAGRDRGVGHELELRVLDVPNREHVSRILRPRERGGSCKKKRRDWRRSRQSCCRLQCGRRVLHEVTSLLRVRRHGVRLPLDALVLGCALPGEARSSGRVDMDAVLSTLAIVRVRTACITASTAWVLSVATLYVRHRAGSRAQRTGHREQSVRWQGRRTLDAPIPSAIAVAPWVRRISVSPWLSKPFFGGGRFIFKIFLFWRVCKCAIGPTH